MPAEPPDIYVDDRGYWRVFRDPFHGLCLEVLVGGVAMYGLTIRLNEEEQAWVSARNYVEFGSQADRLRSWPDRFEDRILRGAGTQKQRE